MRVSLVQLNAGADGGEPPIGCTAKIGGGSPGALTRSGALTSWQPIVRRVAQFAVRSLGDAVDAIVEFTLMVGCPLKCTFCPQDALRDRYGRNTKYFLLENFTAILAKVPKHVRIDFSGGAAKQFWQAA